MGEPGRDTSGVITRVVLYVRQHGGDQAVAAIWNTPGRPAAWRSCSTSTAGRATSSRLLARSEPPWPSVGVTVLFVDLDDCKAVNGGLRESALARAIVQLGQAVGLATVAEGIETGDQVAVLRELGCGYSQGYWSPSR